MQQHYRTSLLTGSILFLLQCIAYGLFISTILIGVVMLLSDNAFANPPVGEDAGEMVHVDRPEEVTQGTLLFRNQDDFCVAPVLRTDVQITVTGMIARTVLQQKFKNPLEEWQEGVYVFPLPEDAAVDYMRLHIGERIIEGQVREKEQARKEYKQAKKSGKKASLVEQERPNIFTTSVANIAPGETVVVEIRYQNIVQYDSGKFHLRFPMVVAPRYIPGNTVIEGYAGTGWSNNTDQVNDASRITPPVLHPDQGLVNPVSISVMLQTGFPLESISSTYHGIRIEQTGNTSYEVKLDNGDIPANRDFELIWQPEPAHLPRAALFSEDREEFRYAMLMLLPPQRTGSNVLGREMIFVIDTSGSMAGTSIMQAKEAMVFALDRLRPGDRFNIIQFNSSTSQLFTFPQPFSHQSLRQAKNYVMSLKANGGTEMAGALHAALEFTEQEYSVRQVIFMTDGSIGNETQLFNIIRQKLGNTRLFTVGIGSAPNGYFMRQAAELGRGTHTYIGKVDEVNEKMQSLFRKLENPVLTNLGLDWGEQETESWPVQQPDLYSGEPLLVLARSAHFPADVLVTGTIAGDHWQASMPITGGRQENGLAKLWARRKIASLTNQLHNPELKEEIRTSIINTALEHHLVSKFTSLVATDITPSRPQDEQLKTRPLPTNLPEGWEYEKVFGQLPATATPSLLHILLGFLLMLIALLFKLTRIPVRNAS